MGRKQRIETHETRQFSLLGTVFIVTQSALGWIEYGNRSGHPDTWEEDDGETETLFTSLRLKSPTGKEIDYTWQMENVNRIIVDGKEIKIGTDMPMLLGISLLSLCENLWEGRGSIGEMAKEIK